MVKYKLMLMRKTKSCENATYYEMWSSCGGDPKATMEKETKTYISRDRGAGVWGEESWCKEANQVRAAYVWPEWRWVDNLIAFRQLTTNEFRHWLTLRRCQKWEGQNEEENHKLLESLEPIEIDFNIYNCGWCYLRHYSWSCCEIFPFSLWYGWCSD